jgi:hypothetical protein
LEAATPLQELELDEAKRKIKELEDKKHDMKSQIKEMQTVTIENSKKTKELEDTNVSLETAKNLQGRKLQEADRKIKEIGNKNAGLKSQVKETQRISRKDSTKISGRQLEKGKRRNYHS